MWCGRRCGDVDVDGDAAAAVADGVGVAGVVDVAGASLEGVGEV